MQRLYGLIKPDDEEGNPAGEEIFNPKPRAFIVAGNLSGFTSSHGVNTNELRFLERYRNNIIGIDILTFDSDGHSKFTVEIEASKRY